MVYRNFRAKSVFKFKRNAQMRANKVLQKSVSILSRKNKKLFSRRRSLLKTRTKQLCSAFLLSGRCVNGERCKFLHDASKVTVCTKFVRGACFSTKCPFSHDLSPDNMPLCRYFLQGVCSRPNCPFLHVKHSQSAKVCAKFKAGYCPDGAKCTDLHLEREIDADNKYSYSPRSRILLKKSPRDRTVKNTVQSIELGSKKSKEEPLPSYIALSVSREDEFGPKTG